MGKKFSISSSLVSLTRRQWVTLTHRPSALIRAKKAPPPQIKRVGLTVEETLTESLYFILSDLSELQS